MSSCTGCGAEGDWPFLKTPKMPIRLCDVCLGRTSDSPKRAYVRSAFSSSGFGLEFHIYDRHGKFLATAMTDGAAEIIVAALNEVYK